MGTASTFGSGARRADIRVYFDAEGMRALFEALNVGDDLQNLAFHVIEAEWRAFDSVTGLFGRAACQDDARSFFVYRLAQHLAFPPAFLQSVASDLDRASHEGERNIVEEKYARMMAHTDRALFERLWSGALPVISPVKAAALGCVRDRLAPMLEEAARELPRVSAHGRALVSQPGAVSGVDYFMSEVACYSLGTIWSLLEGLACFRARGVNPIANTYVYALCIDHALGEMVA